MILLHVFISLREETSCKHKCFLTHWLTITLADSADPDEMPHKVAFHQGLHCLLRYKQSPGTEIYRFIEISVHEPFQNGQVHNCCINMYGITHLNKKGLNLSLCLKCVNHDLLDNY